MNVELIPTSTSGSSPAGGVQSPAQAGSSSRGPTIRTFGGGENCSYSNARLVIRRRRSARSKFSSTEPAGSRPLARLASFSWPRPLSNSRLIAPLIAASRARPSGPRAGFSPGPSGGVPEPGKDSRFDTRNANGTPSASAAI